MNKDNVVTFENPAKSIIEDHLTEFLKESAQKMLKVAIEAEVNEFICINLHLILQVLSDLVITTISLTLLAMPNKSMSL